MEPSNNDKIPLYNILYFVGGTGLLAEWKRWGMPNISGNGHAARVALQAYPTYNAPNISDHRIKADNPEGSSIYKNNFVLWTP
jgi:hypothetical protein